MDKKKEEFLAELRKTFRDEAREHIEAITAGLMAIERSSDAERAPIVERVFREAHSLKGAARSVSLPSVETLCAELESLFAAAKSRELALSTAILDGIHPAIDLIAELCTNPGVAPSPESVEKEKQTIAVLRQMLRKEAQTDAAPTALAIPTTTPVIVRVEQSSIVDGPPPPLEPIPPPPPPAVPVTTVATTESSAPAREEMTATAPTTPAITLETVRIATRKLHAILTTAEELVGAKLSASGQAAELHRLAVDLGHWNQRRIRQTSRLRQTMKQQHGQEGNAIISELIESEMLHTKALENALRNVARAAQQEARTLATLADNLLEDTKKALLLPCSTLLGIFPKLVRDLARERDKEAELLIRGEDIEIDRRVLEELKDPLIHLLRNSIDHGIEKTSVRLERGKARHATVTITVTPVQGNRVEIAICDDGAGIDAAQVRKSAVRLGLLKAGEAARIPDADVIEYIFHSGLSTSPIITDLSGRGLGLAIVREKVEQLGGSVAVTSQVGMGATFRLVAPLSRATFRGVLVEVAGQHFAVPSASVARVTRIKPSEMKTVENRQTVAVGGRAVALARLRDVLGLSGPDIRSLAPAWPVVVIRVTNREVAFLVDAVLGEQEIMVKSLGSQLLRVRNIDGASISANGTIVPILNAQDLIESAGLAGILKPISEPGTTAVTRRRLLVAEDSITARTLVKTILESAGYYVVATVDGLDALTTLKTDPFDLVISDVDMPRMNGFELTSRIRADQKLKELPVILVTALGSQRDREYGIEVGANAYIVKSDFDQGNLLEIIQRLL